MESKVQFPPKSTAGKNQPRFQNPKAAITPMPKSATKIPYAYWNGAPESFTTGTADSVTVTVDGGGDEFNVDGVCEESTDEVGTADSDEEEETDDEDSDAGILADDCEGSTVTPRLINPFPIPWEVVPAYATGPVSIRTMNVATLINARATAARSFRTGIPILSGSGRGHGGCRCHRAIPTVARKGNHREGCGYAVQQRVSRTHALSIGLLSCFLHYRSDDL